MPKIKDMPLAERPREKAEAYGVESLAVSELLAILIGFGGPGHSAIEISQSLLADFHGLKNLAKAPFLSISETYGVSRVKALQIASAFELGHRLEQINLFERPKEASPKRIYSHFRVRFSKDRQETLFLLMFDRYGSPIKEKMMYQGTAKELTLASKEIITELLQNYAFSYVLAHNHPSGSPLPSEKDIVKTLELSKQTKDMGIEMEDHLVVGDRGYYSFREAKIL